MKLQNKKPAVSEPGFPAVIKYTLLGMIILAFMLLGFVRDQYILNLSNPESPLLISRYESSLSVNVLEAPKSAPTDVRWYSLPVYLILHAGFTAAALWILFKKKDALLITGIGYGILVLTAAMLLLLSKFSIAPQVSYIMAQQLKELILSPFLAMVLVVFIYGSSSRQEPGK